MISIKRILSVLLAVSIGLSFAACGAQQNSGSGSALSKPVPTLTGAQVLDYNPLTGQPLAEGVQKGQRPIGVMVNNAHIAMPQRGIAAADAVFEMLTEGGITRLLALYSDYKTMPQVGPVRSARDQHLQFAIPLNAIMVHIGSSVYAENLFNEYQYQDIDGRYLGTTSFDFDAERAKTRASEHCWYTSGALVAAGIENKQIATTGESHPLFRFSPANQPTSLSGGDAPDVVFNFSPENTVQLTYNAETKLYAKKAYGEPHVDELDGAQLAFSNVVILTAQVGLKPDEYCTDFVLTKGTGWYIYGGKYKQIQWEKGKPEDPIKLTDEKGAEILVNPGKSYIAVLGTDMADTVRMDANAPITEPVSSASAAAQ